MIRVIIVDDEDILADYLKRTLAHYHPDINVISVCNSMEEAEKAIRENHPDIVFLDVELGNGETAFDLLKKIENINFEIIFTTGYNQYAIQAIKLSALDFLLKPINENELNASIEEFRNRKFKIDSRKMKNFLFTWANPENQQNKMTVPSITGYDLVTIADIIYCEGLSNQTLLVLTGKKEIVVSMTLKECEDVLTSYKFFRIHKSYLVNLNHVRRYIKSKDGVVVMSNDANLGVSNSFRDKLIEKLKIPS